MRLWITSLLALALPLTLATPAAALDLRENFDGQLTGPGRLIAENLLVHLARGRGVGNSTALLADYVGNEQGSERIVVIPAAGKPSLTGTLSFSVRFCPGFDFARGGKLNGLGPDKPITGGHHVTPLGWSARMMFEKDGGLMTYIYHQDMKGKFGDTVSAPDFHFVPDRWYRIVFSVKLNDPPEKANGRVTVRVDDRLLIDHEGLRFRDRKGDDGLISRLLFSTFHGGNSPDWAPRNADGSFKTDCAYFDEINVTN